ncbi:MAG: acyl-CoA thioesterase [Planctomycetota bacterium]|jgi:acyl-CoA thioester hydrolase
MARPPIPECAPKLSIPKRGELRVRPRYVECDPMGVVHHSSYLPWMEMARTEMLRECGVSYADLERMGVFLVITRLDVRYLRPARYDQELLLRCEVVGGGRARLNHGYELLEVREDGTIGTVLLTASTTLACVDGDGRPTPLPGWLTPGSHDA